MLRQIYSSVKTIFQEQEFKKIKYETTFLLQLVAPIDHYKSQQLKTLFVACCPNKLLKHLFSFKSIVKNLHILAMGCCSFILKIHDCILLGNVLSVLMPL